MTISIPHLSIAAIDAQLAILQAQLYQVKGTPTEVYTRIVGYHRSVPFWNKGKKEEYKHRLPFKINEGDLFESKENNR